MEEAAVAYFLGSASHAPSALLIDGEAGIGKTTLWQATLERARDDGFRVLSARNVSAESVLAYATLADLLADIDPVEFAGLPTTQRVAVEQIRRADRADAVRTDRRAVAAAFLSVIEGLARHRPLLLAIDDVQCVDPSSAHVLSYTARRLSGPVGVLGTMRTDGEQVAHSWLQLRRPDATQRVSLRPLDSRALHAVVTQHIERPLSRSQMAGIYQTSGGNPFYAIELAKVADERTDASLPTTLAAVVQARLDGLGSDTMRALLAVAAAAHPTVDLVAGATGSDHDRAVEVLEVAEGEDIIVIEGSRIRFTHPLLATGVYTGASPDERRQMHAELAAVVVEPELQARHLALAARAGDPQTVAALDRAAQAAQTRGAPMAAAELTELAFALGAQTVERRMRLAGYYFDAGDPTRARTLLEAVVPDLQPGPLRAEALHMLAVVRFVDDGYGEAVRLLAMALDEDAPDGPPKAVMLTTLAYGLYMTGAPETAWRRVEEAVAYAEQIGVPGLLSMALGVRATIQFFLGGGIDEPSMRRALELEDTETFTPIMLRPSVEHALMLACVGELDRSYEHMRDVSRRCVDHGEEGELVFVEFYAALTRIWRADFVEAKRVARDITELARQLGSEFPAMLNLVLQAWLAAYDGAESKARLAAADAIDASRRSGTAWHEDWALTALGFLEVSLGNYAAAITVLQPLISRLEPKSTEIQAAAFVPDAVEALVGLDRASEAEGLVAALERNGERLDRAWMLAVAGRCRALLYAAGGDLDGAVKSAHRALEHHDRLAMPFERARTQLLLGQLQGHARDPHAAATTRQALTAFERLGARVWADRARAELAALGSVANSPAALTAAELRVAELAAAGLTNRDVAGRLFISAKTVEATLARVYRKLGIRSRAELGRVMDESKR
ncbi:LuxR family transcriptional regulator [Mycolicibacterium sp. GF69]|uniref:AAA family ATPase n=1 Tax=Mycolicibacterium sp. GF69 TaxID=2267251 RepID=UPI000DCBD103|nr:LuxR family transcriptional regulator [Mycolicibacterium sp. GF69]RAV13898.1 LuxR family transcriptional regulator [Mycolicibacterium sp. GF69]